MTYRKEFESVRQSCKRFWHRSRQSPLTRTAWRPKIHERVAELRTAIGVQSNLGGAIAEGGYMHVHASYEISGEALALSSADGKTRALVPLTEVPARVRFKAGEEIAFRRINRVIVRSGRRKQIFVLDKTALAALRSALVRRMFAREWTLAGSIPRVFGLLGGKGPSAVLSLGIDEAGVQVEGDTRPLPWSCLSELSTRASSIELPGVSFLMSLSDEQRFWLAELREYAKLRARYVQVRVHLPTGEQGTMDQTEFAEAVLSGTFGLDTKVSACDAAGQGADTWAPLREKLGELPAVEVLYKPLYHYARGGFREGIAVGLCLFVPTILVLLQHGRIVDAAGVAGGSVVAGYFYGGVVGWALGGINGCIRARSMRRPRDVELERPVRAVWYILALPLAAVLFGALLFAAWKAFVAAAVTVTGG